MAKRAVAAVLLIVLMSAGAVSARRAAGARRARRRRSSRPATAASRSPTCRRSPPREAGKPQTIMLLGTDGAPRRRREPGVQPRSDTIILARLNAQQGRDHADVDPARPEGHDPGLRATRTRSTRRTPTAARDLTLKTVKDAARRARRAVQDQPRRRGQLHRLPRHRRLPRLRVRRHRPPLLQRRRRPRRLRRRSTSPRATRSSAAPDALELRALPPHRQRPRPRRAPAGLHPPAAAPAAACAASSASPSARRCRRSPASTRTPTSRCASPSRS